jgi:hypothetical protein
MIQTPLHTVFNAPNAFRLCGALPEGPFSKGQIFGRCCAGCITVARVGVRVRCYPRAAVHWPCPQTHCVSVLCDWNGFFYPVRPTLVSSLIELAGQPPFYHFMCTERLAESALRHTCVGGVPWSCGNVLEQMASRKECKIWFSLQPLNRARTFCHLSFLIRRKTMATLERLDVAVGGDWIAVMYVNDLLGRLLLK